MKYDITKCETKVMMVIWSADKAVTLTEIMERLQNKYNSPWKPQTVSTFLTRLVKKEILTMRREGRLFLYAPSITKDEALRALLGELSELWCDGEVDFTTALARQDANS